MGAGIKVTSLSCHSYVLGQKQLESQIFIFNSTHQFSNLSLEFLEYRRAELARQTGPFVQSDNMIKEFGFISTSRWFYFMGNALCQEVLYEVSKRFSITLRL